FPIRRSSYLLQVNNDFLPDGYSDTLILTKSLDEVMADKIISLPATTRYVRHRDIWDLAWLQQQGATLTMDFVKNKVSDYKLKQFNTMLEKLIDRLPDIVSSQAFIAEMKRYILTDGFDRTLTQDKFKVYVQHMIDALYK